MVFLKALHPLRLHQADLFFFFFFSPDTLFVSPKFIDFMAICAKLSWVASDFMETAKRGSMQATRWA